MSQTDLSKILTGYGSSRVPKLPPRLAPRRQATLGGVLLKLALLVFILLVIAIRALGVFAFFYGAFNLANLWLSLGSESSSTNIHYALIGTVVVTIGRAAIAALSRD